jgi:hypothetical protein
MKKNSWLADYLTLSRKERTGVLLVGVLVLTLFLLPALYAQWFKVKKSQQNI